ncbi:hypothetical protein BU15DRAFT_38277, partial [Melanogaster broomeanus]
FISSADELFGPVTSYWHPGQPTKHLPWTAFMMTPSDWECVNDVYQIISDANSIQHIFSHDHLATLWCAIPAFEELQTSWEVKSQSPKFSLYKDAIRNGLNKLAKYYNKFDEKPVCVLALILHPYYKLAYIKMAWGGPKEQHQELEARNPNAKDWHDEALKILEHMVKEYW